MTDTIGGRPFWRLVFDADGDPDADLLRTLGDEVGARGITDLVVFAHGWNNQQDTALRLYERWFGILATQLWPARKVGFVGVLWPSVMWRDEPIPDFPAAPPVTDDGAAAMTEGASTASVPVLDAGTLADLRAVFETDAAQLDSIAALLASPSPSPVELFAALRTFAAGGPTDNDGEADAEPIPGMLDDGREPADLFRLFASRLAKLGVEFEPSDESGAAGLGDLVDRIRSGATEVLRQLTYWKMKNRAGVVGRDGLGKALGRLATEHPGLRVHLVGHSFGGRLVSYALAGVDSASPIASITLLQGAFSRFAFTDSLPFRDGKGSLAGLLGRMQGPLTVCYSSHDSALGTFYPLASAAAGDDAADAGDPLFRFRAMGARGAYDRDSVSIGPVGTAYSLPAQAITNIDASDVVVAGGPPSGAHSDIVKPELTWIVALASGLTP